MDKLLESINVSEEKKPPLEQNLRNAIMQFLELVLLLAKELEKES